MEPHPARRHLLRKLLEACSLGSVTEHVDSGFRYQGRRPDEDVDALLMRQAAGIQKAATWKLARADRGGVDEVVGLPHAAREDTRLSHLPGQEPARRDEQPHRRVGPGEAVRVGLHRHQHARGQGSFFAAPRGGVIEPAAQARLAEPAVVEELVAWARELVVVQRHDARHVQAREGPQDRGRELVIDVVQVDDVGPEVLHHLLHACRAARRVEHPRRRLDLRPHGRRPELHIARKVTRIGHGLVVGVVHAEERDLVAGSGLQLGEVEHVRLSAASAIEELIDVEDAHPG